VRHCDLPAFALLIGLRPSDGYDQAIIGNTEIRSIDADKLRSAETPGVAQQQQSAVAAAGKTVRQRRKHPDHVRRQNRSFALRM